MFWANNRQENKREKRHYTSLEVQQSIISPWKFVFGDPTKQEPRRKGLKFNVRREMCRRYGIMTRRLIIFSISQKETKKGKKSVIYPGKIKNERKIRQFMKIRIRL